MRRRSFLEAAAAIIPASITLGMQKPTTSEDRLEPADTPSMVPIFWDAKAGKVTTNQNGNEKFGYVINPAD